MKKQFLTFALLATVAVGGAFAGNVKRVVTEAGPINTSGPCDQQVNCKITPGTPCTVNGVQYGLNNEDSGLCDIFLSRD